jgi:uncharacterized phage protein (TIGR01671 family)
MNREIKFRVWNNTDKTFDSPANLEVFNYNGKLFHLYDEHGKYTTIQQFTGVKDINDKEIYEGDIVSFKRCDDHQRIQLTYYSEVEFQDGRFGFVMRGFNERFMDIGADFVEVVGNVFENPELLDRKA